MQAESNARQEELRARLLPQIHQQLEQGQTNLDVVRGKLGDLVEKAHVAGRVTDIALNIGDNVNPGTAHRDDHARHRIQGGRGCR